MPIGFSPPMVRYDPTLPSLSSMSEIAPGMPGQPHSIPAPSKAGPAAQAAVTILPP